MRVFAVSDLHVDHEINLKWLKGLSNSDFKDDILILAGDITDNLNLLGKSFQILASRFNKVLFVPGNHDCWVIRDQINTSIEKFHKVIDVCSDFGVGTDVYQVENLTIVPLFSWYDFSFGKPCMQLKASWGDFFCCKWPDNYLVTDIADYFLSMNIERLSTVNDLVISFSHFLPRIDIMPDFIPESIRYLYPVLGSYKLNEQLNILNPQIHIYGHSHVNWQVQLGGVQFINNAYGYPTETRITRKDLRCVYES
ncbi:metallophosphoesterase [Photorhabdus sp. RM71S]|uniref:metallophosphoesterase family protein n=1 Tax=Photorhabdus sp. RM71S TaxID=3342824 RepID=UPI0036DB87B3